MALPVLQCVLVEAKKTGVTFRATNLELGVERVIAAKVTEEGVVAVPASVLASTITNARGTTPVSISTNPTTLTVVADGGRAVIKLQPHDDFPSLPAPVSGVAALVPAPLLARLLRSVMYAASASTIKPELASVMLTMRDGSLVAAATDSFRLAEKVTPISGAATVPTVLIPAKSVADVVRTLEEAGNDEIRLLADDHQLLITTSKGYVTSRLIEGSFPDYQKIIPKQFTSQFTALKGDVLHILKKASVFSDKFNQVTLRSGDDMQSVELTTQNPDVGELSETLPGAVSGEAFSISFNLRYIADAFQSIPEDSITFALSGAGKPMVIRGAGDTSFTYLVMPMNR